MTYLVSTWIFTGVNVSLVTAVPLHARIGLGYALFLLSLVALPFIDLMVHHCILSIHTAYYFTIFSIAVVGVGSGGQYIVNPIPTPPLIFPQFSSPVTMVWLECCLNDIHRLSWLEKVWQLQLFPSQESSQNLQQLTSGLGLLPFLWCPSFSSWRVWGASKSFAATLL